MNIKENGRSKKEYKNLKQGIIMELPEKMQAFFEEQNIEIISGISWLKKNGRTVKENQKLVKNNPFCLIALL